MTSEDLLYTSTTAYCQLYRLPRARHWRWQLECEWAYPWGRAAAERARHIALLEPLATGRKKAVQPGYTAIGDVLWATFADRAAAIATAHQLDTALVAAWPLEADARA